MTHQVNSYRLVDFISRKVVEGWIAREEPRVIPWAPLDRPLDESIEDRGCRDQHDLPIQHPRPDGFRGGAEVLRATLAAGLGITHRYLPKASPVASPEIH